MLKIGEFSKLSRISIRMLRHYDEIGLLVPDEVDDFTGYRYYRMPQFLAAEQIQVLKNMGFGLTVIKEIMEKNGTPGELEKFLLIKQSELLEQASITQQRLQILANTIKWLRKDGNYMDYNVNLKVLPKRYVASTRQVIPAYDREGILWQLMREEVAPQNVQMATPSYGLAIFHDQGYKESDVDVEIQSAVTGEYQDTDHVKFKTIEPIQMASVTFKGSYEQITRVNEALAKWICENGYDFDGTSFSIYHVNPCDAATPEDLVTEVCYPVKKKS